MKAITTGFAITALAAAISGQAMAADTEHSWTFEGEIEVSSVLVDTIGDAVAVDSATGERNTGSAEELMGTITVTNGGFEGTITLENGAIATDAVSYTEGAISFGDIGSVVTTEGYIANMSDDLAYTADSAFRFTQDGMKVQAFGGATYAGDVSDFADADFAGELAYVDFGMGASYAGEADSMSYVVDFQYAEQGMDIGADNQTVGDNTPDVDDTALDMYYGVGVTSAVSDELSASVAYTSGINALTSYGVRADYTADSMTAYGSYINDSADANTIYVGGTFVSGAVTAYADYVLDGDITVGATYAGEADAVSYNAMFEYVMPSVGTSTMAYGVDAAYAVSDMMSATAEYRMDHAELTRMAAGVAYTTEGGAVMAVDYVADQGWDGEAAVDAVTASASYSF